MSLRAIMVKPLSSLNVTKVGHLLNSKLQRMGDSNYLPKLQRSNIRRYYKKGLGLQKFSYNKSMMIMFSC